MNDMIIDVSLKILIASSLLLFFLILWLWQWGMLGKTILFWKRNKKRN